MSDTNLRMPSTGKQKAKEKRRNVRYDKFGCNVRKFPSKNLDLENEPQNDQDVDSASVEVHENTDTSRENFRSLPNCNSDITVESVMTDQ